MKLSFTTLDVFTSTPFTGNPLAVVHVPATEHLTQEQKQAITAEFNLSETVFIHPATSDGIVPIDIFTHIAEVPFAGHPTIGTAVHTLTAKPPSQQKITALLTKAGRIPVSLQDGVVRAEIPHDVHVHGLTIPTTWATEPSPVVSIVKGMTFVLVHLESVEQLAKPQKTIIENTYDATGLDPGWDVGIRCTYFYVLLGPDERGRTMIRSRMFGSREDPATGSAASGLASYLTLMQTKEDGEGPFKYAITQGVEMGRRSEIGIEVVRSKNGKDIVSVVLSGTAVEIMEGSLNV